MGGDAPAAWTEGDPVRTLQPIASSVLMKVLYGARAARWDLLKAVQLLATRVTKWSRECDKALHRLMCYINCTANHCLSGFVGDGPSALRLRLYADADLAGDRPEFKSTSGVFLAMVGPSAFFPLAAKAQKKLPLRSRLLQLRSSQLGLRFVPWVFRRWTCGKPPPGDPSLLR